MIEVIKRSTTS